MLRVMKKVGNVQEQMANMRRDGNYNKLSEENLRNQKNCYRNKECL